MVDYAAEIYQGLYNTEDIPEEMNTRRKAVVGKLKTLQSQAESIVSFLSDEPKVQQLRQDKAYNLQLLQEQYQIGPSQIDALYNFAKFQFECGNYSGAAEFLYHYRTLATNSERVLSALWGKLAAEILMQQWETALDDIQKLRDIIDGNTFAPILQQLQQRVWLMHWSLFVFFEHENGRNAIIDLFFQDRYLNALQTTAQHLLRYLAAAVVVNKRRRNAMKDLIRVIEQEAYEYSDPITQFLECLFVRYDFEGAQVKLKECEAVLENDYFLAALKDDFVENARLFIFETYCRIHQCIDMRMLAGKLNMDEEAAEKWIVNLIRNARLNAKIDSQAGTVVMGMQFPSAYEQVMDKAKALSQRTFMLANLVVGAPQT
ncbi:g10334 [Coccomyxa viridis]|uniref:Eukaryotic translation initiation factor 3 subunit E n=1 Tax=Coccomyxa viridis TaxID=1274662 RepID=A0ABP1GC56_9CHLO